MVDRSPRSNVSQNPEVRKIFDEIIDRLHAKVHDLRVTRVRDDQHFERRFKFVKELFHLKLEILTASKKLNSGIHC